MGTIGYTALAGGGRESRSDATGYDVNLRDTYIPAQNEELDQCFLQSEGNTTERTINVGVVRLDTGAVVGEVTFTIPANDPAETVYQLAYPAGLVLQAGVEYAQMLGSGDSATSVYAYRTGGVTGDNTRVVESGQPFPASVTLPGTDNNLNRHTHSTTKAITTAVRKGSSFDVETTLSGTVTAAVLNGNAITVDSQTGTTVTLTDSGSAITTSGEYNLVLTDDSADPDETIALQVNVPGLASYNINKDGADQGSLTDVEFVIMTGAAGSRAIVEQITGVTTDASGNTGAIEVTDTSLNVGDTVLVLQQSAAVGGGIPHEATLVAI